MSSLNKSLLLLFILILNQATSSLAFRQAARSDVTIDDLGGKVGLVGCWQAMMELRSCTNEIVLFFLNGESYLSLPCCRAIRLITRSCWPAMLSTLGFTSEEADILRGYCDADVAAPPETGANLRMAKAIPPSTK